VSRSFCARATPFLYGDIRIVPAITESKLSSLANTLNINIKCRHTLDDLSSGYGYYTRTFHLRIGRDAHTLPANLQGLLDKMINLHTFVIRSTDSTRAVPVHSLSSLVFQGVNQSLILDRQTLRVLLPFQRIYIDDSYPPTPGMPQASQVTLLPNLQKISIHDLKSNELLQLFRTFKDWKMPRLESLYCNLSRSESSDSAFIDLLKIQGPLLWDLELYRYRLAPMSEIIPLCSNLRSLEVVSDSHVNLLSFPPHPKLEKLRIQGYKVPREEESYLKQFEKFTTSWRTSFPNLRVGVLTGFEDIFRYMGPDNSFSMRYRTEDSFYTVTVSKMSFKRWEGIWLDPSTSIISMETSV
jgi:hypothetical protein